MVIFFLPDLRGGGAERVMLNLLEAYAQQFPNGVALLLGKKEGPLLAQIPANIPVYELKGASAISSVIPFIKFCKLYQPDQVIASLGSSLATALAKPFISGKIEIINRLGNTIGAEKKLFKSSVKRALYLKANQIIAKTSDKIIFQCHYMANDYISETGIKPKSFKVIYNPVNIDKIKLLSGDPIAEEFDFIAVGRLSPQKDYPTLIKAIGILKDQFKVSLKLIILGDGALRDELEQQIVTLGLSENIYIAGFVKNPYPYFKKSKALISSSLYEGFSNVIVEALSLGTPVIASDCPGANKEVISEEVNGFTFRTSDANDLAKVLYENWDQIENVNRTAIEEDSQKKYNIKTIFASYLAYIKQ